MFQVQCKKHPMDKNTLVYVESEKFKKGKEYYRLLVQKEVIKGMYEVGIERVRAYKYKGHPVLTLTKGHPLLKHFDVHGFEETVYEIEFPRTEIEKWNMMFKNTKGIKY